MAAPLVLRRSCAAAAATAAGAALRAAAAAARGAGELVASATLISAAGAADAAAELLRPEDPEIAARIGAISPVIEAKVCAGRSGCAVHLTGGMRAKRNLAEHAAFGGGPALVQCTDREAQRRQRAGRTRRQRPDTGALTDSGASAEASSGGSTTEVHEKEETEQFGSQASLGVAAVSTSLDIAVQTQEAEMLTGKSITLGQRAGVPSGDAPGATTLMRAPPLECEKTAMSPSVLHSHLLRADDPAGGHHAAPRAMPSATMDSHGDRGDDGSMSMDGARETNGGELPHGNCAQTNVEQGVRIYLSQLPQDMEEDELMGITTEYGKVLACELHREGGFKSAWVEYGSKREAETAVRELDDRRMDKWSMRLQACMYPEDKACGAQLDGGREQLMLALADAMNKITSEILKRPQSELQQQLLQLHEAAGKEQQSINNDNEVHSEDTCPAVPVLSWKSVDRRRPSRAKKCNSRSR